jgi:hypothetical protein
MKSLAFPEVDMEEPPEEPLGLVNTKALCSLLAKGNHVSTVPWGSWRCESTTEANEDDIPWPLTLTKQNS